jgi:hypothetical protein
MYIRTPPVTACGGDSPLINAGAEEGATMYLNIGNDMAVRQRSVLGIFDLDNTSTSRRTREFLEQAEKDGLVIPCDDLPKSFILTQEYGMTRIYLTSLSASTLEKRMK